MQTSRLLGESKKVRFQLYNESEKVRKKERGNNNKCINRKLWQLKAKILLYYLLRRRTRVRAHPDLDKPLVTC